MCDPWTPIVGCLRPSVYEDFNVVYLLGQKLLLTDGTNEQTAPKNLSDVLIICFIFSAVHGFGLKWIYWNVGGDRLKKERVPVRPTEFTACNKLHPRNFLFFSIFRTMMMFLRVWHQSFWEHQIQIHSFWELWPVNHICGRSRYKTVSTFTQMNIMSTIPTCLLCQEL